MMQTQLGQQTQPASRLEPEKSAPEKPPPLPHKTPKSFACFGSSDKFYPDFVVRLKDGRILVVEYKGAPFVDSRDTKEKQMIGEVWAAWSWG